MIVGFLASAYLFIPPLWDAISVSPQQRVKPLEQRITDLDKQIKSSPKPSTIDLKDIATLEKGRIDTEHAIRTTIVQAMVGFLGIATVLIAWKQWKAAQEKQVAERFSKAVEQLGSENIHARLGGIYALEQIAKDAEEKYYWQVMETLTSYVRERSPYPPKPSKQPNPAKETPSDSSSLATDIQAVMTVIARRRHHYGHPLERHRLNLRHVDLRQLELPPRAKLSSVDLQESNLQRVVLRQVNLQNTNLQKANLNEAKLGNTDLREANLSNASLCWASLSKANLQEATCNWTDFRGGSILAANLQKAKFREADLRDTNLSASNLQGANLQKANLQGADLEGVNLQTASLRAANLMQVNFMKANLQETEFKESDPGIVKLIGKCEALGLTWEQISQASFYTKELLPDYLLQQAQPLQLDVAETANSATRAVSSSQNAEQGAELSES